MENKIVVKEVPIEEAVKINATIVEFKDPDAPYQKKYFEDRYKGKDHLIIVAFVSNQPAGYIVGYDEFGDGSFYCWMAGVNPRFRKMGLLKALMEYQDSWAKKKGYRKIKLKTRNNRREMLSYLIKHGFQIIDFEPRDDIGENRILFEKQL